MIHVYELKSVGHNRHYSVMNGKVETACDMIMVKIIEWGMFGQQGRRQRANKGHESMRSLGIKDSVMMMSNTSGLSVTNKRGWWHGGDLAMIGIDNEKCSMQAMDEGVYITAHDVAFEQSANVNFCRNGGNLGIQ